MCRTVWTHAFAFCILGNSSIVRISCYYIFLPNPAILPCSVCLIPRLFLMFYLKPLSQFLNLFISINPFSMSSIYIIVSYFPSFLRIIISYLSFTCISTLAVHLFPHLHLTRWNSICIVTFFSTGSRVPIRGLLRTTSSSFTLGI